MRLSQLIKSLKTLHAVSEIEDFEVKGIACDSKKVADGFIFVAIKGTHADGHAFIQEAIARGAKAVVAGRPECTEKVASFQTADPRKTLAELADEFYGHPSRNIKVIGVTGTNGKTTITYLIEAILREAGRNPSVIGTVNYRFNNTVAPSKNTTPGPPELQALLHDMYKGNVTHAVMEVSSHALDQERIGGIRFLYAIFTNLTQDHLDYHGNLENYFSAKARLFETLDKSACAFINTDDAYGARLVRLCKARTITYGIDTPADVTAFNIEFDIAHTQFSVYYGKKKALVTTGLIGKHNVSNILAAIALALEDGIDPAVIRAAIERFGVVPGRLERIDTGRDFSVFVDYAHTDDALLNVIRTLRQVCRGRIIVVFGCGGDRDKTKRPKMGRVVTELADFAVITSDNPRSEDPAAIIDQIMTGIKKDNYCVVPDRFEAIKKSLSLARAGDAVLVAGKGHEDYQVVGNRAIPFDDRKVSRECLQSLN